MFRVILADDEPIMQKALLALIDWKAMDCEVVHSFSDGQAVLECLDAVKPDIAILDIRMPGASGIDIARFIYENRLPIKVILLTAYADFSYAQQAVSYGVSEYVTKNGATDGVVRAVEKCKRQLLRKGDALPPKERAQMFIKSVLDGSVCAGKELAREAEQCALALKRYALVKLEICAPTDSRMACRMEELLKSVFQEGKVYFVPMGKSCFCAILTPAGEDVARRCTPLAETFSALTGLDVFIGVSAPAFGVQTLCDAYAQADAALEERFYQRETHVHAFQASAPEAAREESGAARMEAVACQVELGSVPRAMQQLEGMLEEIQRCGLPPESARRRGRTLIDLLRARLEKMGVEWPNDEKAQRMVSQCRFFDEYSGGLIKVVQDACRAVARALESGGNVVLSAQRYIKENYRRPITLTEIAGAASVNPSYLSRAFKEKTGATIVDTVNRLKMERAMALLDEKRLRVYEIGLDVGFEDTAYFCRLFKKFTGVSPRAFQERRADSAKEE